MAKVKHEREKDQPNQKSASGGKLLPVVKVKPDQKSVSGGKLLPVVKGRHEHDKALPNKEEITLLGDMPRHQGARNYRAYVLIAGKGFGKTTQAQDDATIYMMRFKEVIDPPMGPRVLIQDYNGVFDGIMTVEEWIARYEAKIGKKLKYLHPLEMLSWVDAQGYPVWKNGKLRYVSNSLKMVQLFHETVFNYFKNGFVILDECSTYLYGNLADWQKKIFYNHRNRGMEVLYIYHLIKRIPMEFCQGDGIYSFRVGKTGEATNDNYKRQILNRYGLEEKLWDAHVEAERLPDRLNEKGEMLRVQNFVEVVL